MRIFLFLQVVHSKPQDLVPSQFSTDDAEIQRPDEDDIQEV